MSGKNKSSNELARTAAERMKKTHNRRKEAGLTRRDVWSHVDDWPTIRKLEAELAEKRGIKI